MIIEIWSVPLNFSTFRPVSSYDFYFTKSTIFSKFLHSWRCKSWFFLVWWTLPVEQQVAMDSGKMQKTLKIHYADLCKIQCDFWDICMLAKIWCWDTWQHGAILRFRCWRHRRRHYPYQHFVSKYKRFVRKHMCLAHFFSALPQDTPLH